MARIQDVQIPYLTFDESASPGTPANGFGYIYVNTGGTPTFVNDAGTESSMLGGGGGAVATDAIWDAKGDLAAGTGANTAQRLAVGTNNYRLVAASGETTGLKWQGYVGASVSGTSTSTNNSSASLAFADADTFDTDSIHDPASNNTRLTVPTGLGGKWLLTMWAATSGGNTDVRLGYRIDGGTDVNLIREYYSDGGNATRVAASVVLSLNAAQYVEVRVFSSGSTTWNPYAAQFSFLGA